MYVLKYFYTDGPHAWIIRDDYVKWKIFNWDRYNWYQSNGLDVEVVRDDEIVRLLHIDM